MKKLTTAEFIERAKKVHADKYDYSKTDLNNRDEKGRICIICPKHGEFWQNPHDHLHGHGCSECNVFKRSTKESFIEKARKVHGNKYDYSKVEYINNKTKVCIICPIHGEFFIRPDMHLHGQGCGKCYGNNTKTTKEWVEEAKNVHKDKYDYSKVIYKGCNSAVQIICPKHGEFWQKAITHLNGHGCPVCAKERMAAAHTKSLEQFIEEAKKIHGVKYDYSKVEYKGNKKEVCIICPKHGEFWQKPFNHLSGCGCPKCGLEELVCENKLYEILLDNFNCHIERQKKFKWLKHINKLSLDFFIPSKNIAIEYQGEQHFKKFHFEKDDTKLLERQLRDKIKIDLCKEHNIKLLHFAFSQKACKNWTRYKVYTDINELIIEINGNF